jgi:hypothetical protein
MQVMGLAGSTAATIKSEEQANNRRSMGTTFRKDYSGRGGFDYTCIPALLQ